MELYSSVSALIFLLTDYHCYHCYPCYCLLLVSLVQATAVRGVRQCVHLSPLRARYGGVTVTAV